MTLVKSITLINDTYWAQVGIPMAPVSLYKPQEKCACAEGAIPPFTPLELSRLAQFGEPVVETGGLVEMTDPGDNFTLPTDQRVFPSQFPVKQGFGTADYEDALAAATAWRDLVVANITAAMESLVDENPGAIGTEISVIDTGGN